MTDPALMKTGDFEAVEAAVMETARGRWFLTEYLKRYRAADTESVLSAIGRLKSSLAAPSMSSAGGDASVPARQIRALLGKRRQDLAAVRPAGTSEQQVDALADWSMLIGGKADVTEQLLEAAGEIQELARRLRETSVTARTGERLAERAAEIYSACAGDETLRRRLEIVTALVREIDAIVGGSGEKVAASGPKPVKPEPVPAKQAVARPSPPQNRPPLDKGVIAFLGAQPSASPGRSQGAEPERTVAQPLPAAAVGPTALSIAPKPEPGNPSDPSADLSKVDLIALFS